MNIEKIVENNIIDSNLNESAQPKVEFNVDLLTIVLKTKSKQFNFDSGVIMGSIKINLTSRFGLQWHYNNTKSFDEFLASVSKFVGTTDNILTENDIKNLSKQYDKYNAKQIKK